MLFVPFIMMTAFAVLNLFIGLMVNSMQSVYEAEYKDEMAKHQDLVREESRLLMERIRGNSTTLSEMREEMREENRALIEKVEESNRQMSALREELAARPPGGGT
jgi:voltage-gated sodium channel